MKLNGKELSLLEMNLWNVPLKEKKVKNFYIYIFRFNCFKNKNNIYYI